MNRSLIINGMNGNVLHICLDSLHFLTLSSSLIMKRGDSLVIWVSVLQMFLHFPTIFRIFVLNKSLALCHMDLLLLRLIHCYRDLDDMFTTSEGDHERRTSNVCNERLISSSTIPYEMCHSSVLFTHCTSIIFSFSLCDSLFKASI